MISRARSQWGRYNLPRTIDPSLRRPQGGYLNSNEKGDVPTTAMTCFVITGCQKKEGDEMDEIRNTES